MALALLGLGRVPDAAAGGFSPVGFWTKQWVEEQGPNAGETFFVVRTVFEIDPAQFGGTATSLDGAWFCFQGNAPGMPLFWPPPPAERLHQAYDFCRNAGLLTSCNRQAEGRIGLHFWPCTGTIPNPINSPESCLADSQAMFAGWNYKARKATQAEINSGLCSNAPVASFSGSAVATPAEVQIEDANAAITVTVTLQNTGSDALTNVAPTADPTPSGGGEVEKAGGPTPASVDLAAGASGTITYTYKPTKGGQVSFFVEGFQGQGSSGPVTAGSVTSNTVTIKQDVEIAVTAEPISITTDSLATSGALVRIKVTDRNGDPIAGQRVRLKFPQFAGIFDPVPPRVLICNSNSELVFPPGDSPVQLDADVAPTKANGELVYHVWVGTERKTTQLLVAADAIDDADSLLSSDGEFIDLAASGGGGLGPTLGGILDTTQRSRQPDPLTANSAPGLTGLGTPLQVLQSVTRWLEVERERGDVPDLRAVDFVPITSQDQTSAGVLFYNRADLPALLARFSGAPSSVNADVLPIELRLSPVAPDPLSLHEVKWIPLLTDLETWETTRPLNRFGAEDPGLPVRGPAVPAIGAVTPGAYAFLGYPYPTAEPTAAGGYGGDCVPPLGGVSVAMHSPVTLLVKNPGGQAVGVDASGAYVNDVPGAVYSGGEPARYLLPPGSYQADIFGTDKGPATLILSAPGIAPKTFSLKAKAGKTGTLTFDDTLASAAGTFNKKKLKSADGVPITVTGVKKKIKVRSGDALTLTVTNLFGNGVAGARVHATGTGFDAETLTGADGVASMPLVVTKATKKLTVTIDGAGVQLKTLKLKVKLLK
jgi:hypothetical protein